MSALARLNNIFQPPSEDELTSTSEADLTNKRKASDETHAPAAKKRRTGEVTKAASAALTSAEASSASGTGTNESRKVAPHDIPLLKALQTIFSDFAKVAHNKHLLIPDLLIDIVQYAHQDIGERLLQAAQKATDEGEFSEINSNTTRMGDNYPTSVLDAISQHLTNPKFIEDPQAYLEKEITSESKCGYEKGQDYRRYCGKASFRFSSIAFIEQFLANECKPQTT